MKIILFGAPGSGKGTQAALISKKYNLPHISTGDIFRENIKNSTPLGLKVKAILDAGHFCPDDITVELVKDRLSKEDCKDGYLLDGFPRDMEQAEALEKFSTPDAVLNLVVNLDKIEKRITGRRNCCACKGSFNVEFIGDTNVCPTCGGKLIRRDDDNPETVKERLAVYKEKTEPLVSYYQKQGKLINVDGDKSVEDVFAEIQRVLD